MLLLAIVGCGSNEKKAEKEHSHLKPLMIFCGQFTGQNRGRPPANDDELKAFIKSKGPEAIKAFNVTDADALFISPRDNQPYVIMYDKLGGGVPGMGGPGGVGPGMVGPGGVGPGAATPGGAGASGPGSGTPGTAGSSAGGASGLGGQPVAAYESTGVGGKRFVASALGAVEEVDEQKFRELVPTAR